MRQTFFGSPKSIAGAAMVGLGLLILVGNLDGAATEWSRLIGATRGETLGYYPPLFWRRRGLCKPMRPINGGFCRVSLSTC